LSSDLLEADVYTSVVAALSGPQQLLQLSLSLIVYLIGDQRFGGCTCLRQFLLAPADFRRVSGDCCSSLRVCASAQPLPHQGILQLLGLRLRPQACVHVPPMWRS